MTRVLSILYGLFHWAKQIMKHKSSEIQNEQQF